MLGTTITCISTGYLRIYMNPPPFPPPHALLRLLLRSERRDTTIRARVCGLEALRRVLWDHAGSLFCEVAQRFRVVWKSISTCSGCMDHEAFARRKPAGMINDNGHNCLPRPVSVRRSLT
jgi:hypothetical protein